MKDGKLVGKTIRTHNNVNVFDGSGVNFYLRNTNEAWLWHKGLGHMNFDNLIRVIKLGIVRGLWRLSRPENSIFKSCQFGKQVRTHFKSKEFSSSRPLELIHTYVCGSTREKYLRGEKYTMLLIDDFTKATWIVLLREKLEEFKDFKKLKAQVENEKDLNNKFLRSLRGGEYTSRDKLALGKWNNTFNLIFIINHIYYT